MFRCFQSNERKDLSINSELDYFMNEERSDVRFIVEGQPIPALKAFLSVKSRVFHAMFSGEFKESKDKEVVIEDTTYEAFKTFIRFVYCDQLVLKEDNDIELIAELWKLSDRYDIYRLESRLTDILYEKCKVLGEYRKYPFHKVWPKMQSILKIAFQYKIEKLMNNVMEYIDKYLFVISTEDSEVLIELNDSTDGRLFSLFADKCTEECFQRNGRILNTRLNIKIKELFNLMTKKCKQLNELKESLKNAKSVECDKCGAFDHVQSIDTSTECKE